MTDSIAPATEHVDVLIIGAGLSGVGAGYHLQTNLPGKSYAILEARDASRRDLGPVPVPGRALGLRHVHARLPLPPVAQQQGDRRRAVDPRLHPRDRERLRDRAQDPLQPPRRQRAVVDRRRTLDRHRRAHRHRRDRHVHRRIPVQLQRLLPLRPGIPAGLPRHRPLQGPDRASAVLVRRRGLRGQARRGDRKRRNRGDDDPRDGRRRRARDDAPALPQLHHVAARRRPRREGAPQRCSRPSSRTRSCAGRTCCS